VRALTTLRPPSQLEGAYNLKAVRVYRTDRVVITMVTAGRGLLLRYNSSERLRAIRNSC